MDQQIIYISDDISRHQNDGSRVIKEENPRTFKRQLLLRAANARKSILLRR